MDDTIQESYATGEVSGYTRVGGLVGENRGTISESYATGVASDNTDVGGLAGRNWGGTIEESYATGDVEGTNRVGGVVGDSEGGTISKSYATGDVEGTNRVGGVVGRGSASAVIHQSYATGSVDGDDDAVGGLIGSLSGGEDIQGLYWDNGTTGQSDAIGIDSRSTNGGYEGFGETTDSEPAPEMMGLNATGNMTPLEFPDGDGTWHVVEDDYPALAWQDTGPVYEVNVTETNAPITTTETLEVTANVTNWGADGEQTVTLSDTDFSNDQQDSDSVSLESGESAEPTLEWVPEVSDAGTGNVTVASDNDTDSEEVTVDQRVDSVTVTIDEAADPTVTTGKAVDVTVSVEDELGEPIEGEEVSIDDLDTGGDGVAVDNLSVSDTATTDSDGVATFEDVTFSGAIDATLEVTVSAEDDTEGEMTVTVGGFADGDGSEASPYEIENWYHLDNVRENPGDGFVLIADLDEGTAGYDEVASETANGGDGFKPMGDHPDLGDRDEIPFAGTFDGDGHTISELYINRSDDYVGVFGYVDDDGTVENVGLEDVSVEGNDFVGGLVGWNNDGTVSEAYATGSVEGSNRVGGLVGHNLGGDMSESYATGSVEGNSSIGGLVGANGAEVSESYATGTVTLDGSGDVGGLVGYNDDGNVKDSYWDNGTTTQDDPIGDDSGTSANLVGFGDVNVDDPAPEMQGLNATVEMHRLDFESTWRPGDDGSPDLAWNSEFDDTADAYDSLVAGDGDAAPYEITTVYELQRADTHLGADFELQNDVEADRTEDWFDGEGFEPIGDGNTAFDGTFDGQGHIISNLTIDRSDNDHVGLFGFAQDSTLEATRLEDVDVTGEGGSAADTGGVGGFVGYLEQSSSSTTATVENVSVSGTVTATGTGYNAGGIVGFSQGGDDGGAFGPTLDNQNVFTGELTAEDIEQVGGIVGRSNYGTDVGIGYVQAEIEGSDKVGGIVGHSSGRASTFESLYFAGNVTGSNSGAVVGFVGHTDDEFKSSVYWDEDLESEPYGDNSEGGTVDMTGLTTDEMQNNAAENNMDELDFENVWQTVGGDYPVFQWQAAAGDTVTVDGTVVDALTGDPIEDATVEAESAGETDTTDQDGEFTLEVSEDFGDTLNATVTGGESADVDEDFTLVNVTTVAPGLTEVTLEMGPDYDGNGTQVNPFRVGTVEDLQQIRYNLSADYVIIDDIDASGTDEWFDGDGFEPLGTEEEPFTGTIRTMVPEQEVFTDVGTAEWTVPTGVTEVHVLVVGGGGGGGDLDSHYGGGGAGGVAHNFGQDAYPVTPGETIDVTVGAGGVEREDGDDSLFGDILAHGGGIGGSHGNDGGSGGGMGGSGAGSNPPGGEATQPGTNPDPFIDLGSDGGTDYSSSGGGDQAGGGGGGATERGGDSEDQGPSGDGGDGVDLSAYLGTDLGEDGWFAGGGGGSGAETHGADGGMGGGGDGSSGSDGGPEDAMPNTGGGGGGTAWDGDYLPGGNGGSGIVVVEYELTGDKIVDSSSDIYDIQHEVTGLEIDRSGDDVGLFGALGTEAEVDGIELRDANVAGNNNVGGLAGASEGQITKAAASGTVTGNDGVGGLVGHNDGNLQSSRSWADVDGNDDVGGLVGNNDGDVDESYAAGDVTGSGTLGGLVGTNTGAISDTYAAGSVDGTTGGLVGETDGGTVTDSFWDIGTTAQDDPIGDDSGSSSNLVGFGETSDDDPASEMQGLNATVYMDAFDFDDEWRVGDDDYPDLAWDSDFSDTADAYDSLVAGDGDAAPYEITTVYELQRADTHLGADFELQNDIDAERTADWYDEDGFEPIGSQSNEFTGTLDGNAHLIGNLTIDRDQDYVGLFGYAEANSLEIADLRLTDVDVAGGDSEGGVGGLAGWFKDGTVSNVSVSGDVVGQGGDDGVGGVVGMLGDSESDALAMNGTVEGERRVGGVVGHTGFDTGLTVAYAQADVEATGSGQHAGGLVGYTSNNPSTFDEMYFGGNVTADHAGGVVGHVDSGADHTFTSSVYWDESRHTDPVGKDDGDPGVTEDWVGLSTEEMQGSGAEDNMDELDFGDTWQWVADDYPVFQWQAAAAGTSDIAGIDAANRTATAGNESAISVIATDQFGNDIEDETINVTATDGLGELSVDDSQTTNESGIATFAFNDTRPGSYTVAFEAENDSSLTDTATVTVEPANATVVSFDSQPADSTAGEVVDGPPRVNVTDAFGNPVDGVEVAVAEEGGYSFDSGTLTNTTTNGISTFDDLVINESATNYQLNFSISASDDGVDANADEQTDPFNVTAADADTLRVIDTPDSVDAGAEFNVTINATDEFDNLAADQTLSDLTVDSEFDGTVFGSTDVSLNETGSANVTIPSDEVTTANDSHTLTAAAPGVAGDSVDIEVNMTAADTATLDTQPTETTANESIGGPPTVSVTDASGNELSDLTLTANLNSSTDLLGTTAVETNDTGVATFDDLRVQEAGSYNLTIEVDGDSTVNATTDSFEITASTPDSVTVDSQPTASTAGESIAGPPQANVTDAFDNPVAGENVTVTINESVGLGGSTEIETDNAGLATFGDLTVTDLGSYELAFELTDDGSVNTTTDAFEVEAADADSITVDSQPTETIAGEPIDGPPTLNVTDAFGNPVEAVGVNATLNESGLQGTTTEPTNESGLVEFDNLSVETVGDYELTFDLDADSTVNVTTVPFEITAATPDSVTAVETTETVGVEGTITVTVTDEFDNPTENTTINVTDDDGLDELPVTAISNESGIAEFSFNETTADSYIPAFELGADGTVTDTATVTVEAADPETLSLDANTDQVSVSDDFTDGNNLVANISVVDRFENPTNDTRIDATHNGTDIEFRDGDSLRTDADGNATFVIQSETDQENIAFNFTEQASGQNVSAQLTGFTFGPIGPEASASANSYTVSSGTDVTFRGNRSTIPDGSNPTFNWSYEWDDGQQTRNATGMANTTSFVTHGEVDATLEMTVANQTVTDHTTISVEDRTAPDVRLDAPDSVAPGDPVPFDASATTDNVDDSADLHYEWNFGNETAINGTGLTEPTGNYSVPDVYDVELAVTDEAGNTATNETTVLVEGSNASVVDDDLEFGEVGTNSTGSLSVPITNNGTTNLNVTETDFTGDNASAFTISGTDEPIIEAGETELLRVAFTPERNESKTAQLGIETNSTVGQTDWQIDLNGTGIESDLVPADSTTDLGAVAVGESGEANVTFENEGTDDTRIADTTIHGDDPDRFSVVDDLPVIPAGETGNVTVAFEPVTDGDRSATLSVETNESVGGETDTAQTSIEATGEGPVIRLGSERVDFETIGINTSDTETETVEIRNRGSQPLEIDSTETTISGEDAGAFEIDQLPSEVEAGDHETLSVNFSDPGSVGTYNATVELAHNDSFVDGESTIDLGGVAEAADSEIPRSNVNFGDVEAGESAVEGITVTNRGSSTANLTVLDTEISGTNADVFEVDNEDDLETPLAPGESHEILVNLTTHEPDQNAQLRIDTDAANEQRTYVYLSSEDAYINVREVSNPTVDIEGGNLPTGSSHDVSVATSSTEASTVTVEELGMSVNNDSFNTVLQNSESAFNNSLDPGDDTLLQYVELNHTDHDSESTFDDTHITFSVDSNSVPSDADHEDIVLNRYNETDGEWNALEPEFLEETDDQYRYAVETPGFSEFAVTVTEPTDPSPSPGPGQSSSPSPSPDPDPESNITVTAAMLEETTITEGEAATVTVTLENDGDADGDYTLELTADGTALATESVAVDAGETTNTTLSIAPDAGEYDLELNGYDVGTLVVEPDRADDDGVSDDDDPADDDGVSDDDDPADDSDEEDVGTADDGTSSWILLLLGALGAIVLLFVLLWRRREGEDETDGQSSTE